MKIVNLQYHNLFKHYFIDYGPNHVDKDILGSLRIDDLEKTLKNKLDIKRNTALFLKDSIYEKIGDRLSELFKKQK